MSEFNQSKYKSKWDKENMAFVGAKYKKDFVDEFKKACEYLNIKQSEIIRSAMLETINSANKKR